MKVAVLGSSGFIGNRFIEIYKNKFKSIKELTRLIAPLNDYKALLEQTRGVDCLIHAAFDHSYKSNIKGIKNVIKVCKKNKINKLIYLSTISVYDSNTKDDLTEDSDYSKYNDPYSRVKIKVENILEQNQDCVSNIIILQPSIVFGLGGNWTKYAFMACKTDFFLLPNAGEYNCNVVYVDDVANAIYQGCLYDISFGKFLISGSDIVTWRQFYQGHLLILKKLNIISNLKIKTCCNNNEFHSNYFFNKIFQLWFLTRFGLLLNSIAGVLKTIRGLRYRYVSSQNRLFDMLKSQYLQPSMEPIGITKKVHQSQFKVCIKKSNQFLNFSSKCSFQKGLLQLEDECQRLIK